MSIPFSRLCAERGAASLAFTAYSRFVSLIPQAPFEIQVFMNIVQMYFIGCKNDVNRLL